MKKYQVIYADPPWKFTDYVKETKSGLVRPPLPYPFMTDDEIENLPISDIVADDALLFLWVVDSRIPIASAIMKKWGFKFITTAFVWNKAAKHTDGVNATYSAYTRKSVELCFVGRRGKSIIKSHGEYQYLGEPKREHSRKPDEIRHRIQRMTPDLLRIELFARQKTAGWDTWGNEVENDIEITHPITHLQ